MKRARRPKKTPGRGLTCPRCGQPLYVVDTRPRGKSAVDRVRRCLACGWECESSEVLRPRRKRKP